jgi:hypothetical protein
MERRPGTASLDREVVFETIEFKCEKAKFCCADCKFGLQRQRKAAAGSLRRPRVFLKGNL